MPSVSKAQQEFMAIQLKHMREGKKTKTHMTEQQLEDFAKTKRHGLPRYAKRKREHRYS